MQIGETQVENVVSLEGINQIHPKASWIVDYIIENS